MKQIIPVLSVLLLLTLTSCSNEYKAKKLIDKYMFETAYDYESYEPIEIEVRKSNYSIWFNLQAIKAAKIVVDEYNATHTSFNVLDKGNRYDVNMIILDHLSEFGEYNTWETNVYDGYSILHKFRIKSRGGISGIYTITYIVDNDFSKIVGSPAKFRV